MALQIPFVLLNIAVKLAKGNEPSTGYVELTFANNLGHPHFEQRLTCKVPFDDVLKSPSFSADLKSRIRAFKLSPHQPYKEWLNDWVKLSNMLIAVFQSNSKVYLTFLPPLIME